MNIIIQYIPHHEADAYLSAGWDVKPLECHHGAYSMLATKPEYSVKQKLDRIVEYVSERCECSTGDIRSGYRKRHFAHVRFVIAWVARMLTPASYPMIADALGYMDHTSAMHGYLKSLKLRHESKHHRQMMDEFLSELKKEFNA